MTIAPPPEYVVVPYEYLEQAYKPDKPRRALFATFVRILALAWQSKYTETPRMREEELIEFLKLKRRQYYEQRADMELLGWLRSSHPIPGFVQFTFSRSVVDKVTVQEPSAENRTEVRKTAPLMRIEEEESLKLIKQESSSSSSNIAVRKIALTAESPSEKKMQLLVENLRLLFAPDAYGLLEMREIFLAGIPERVLGWIAKAYHDRDRLGSPIGMIVKHINAQDAPDRYYVDRFAEILPEEYLEAVEEISYGCAYCEEHFGTRDALRNHETETHPYPCSGCNQWFQTQGELATHFEEIHDTVTRDGPFYVDESVRKPIHANSPITPEQAWQSVLEQLQTEMPRASFDTWVRDTKAVCYGRNTLSIGVRNAYARDWLESRLASTVNRLLVGVMNASVNVVFVAATEWR